jgi:hypothetical protein
MKPAIIEIVGFFYPFFSSISFYHIYVRQNNIYGGFQHGKTAEKESTGTGEINNFHKTTFK